MLIERLDHLLMITKDFIELQPISQTEKLEEGENVASKMYGWLCRGIRR